jgi:phage terminase large subunit
VKVETKIHLSKFVARDYQRPLIEAFNSGKFTRYLVVWPRRAGKDVCAFNLLFRAALKKVGVYFYIFPTYSQAKKVIWDSITNTGEKFLDYIPRELIVNTNGTEMKINLSNGSLIQLVGSDNVDSLMGTNPQGIIFSEYALQDPTAYQFLRPIMLANGGWCLFVSTPRGKNHLWELFNIASSNETWFCSKLTVQDTQHISVHEINKEIAEGLISQDLAYQEYYTSFDMGVEGSYYAKYLDKMRVKGQIGIVPYEHGFKVYTAWDLGVRDSTTILFFQIIGQTVRIIDCYENSKVGLEYYVNILRRYEVDKGYVYGKHIAPHDIAVKEFGSGMTRLEKAKQLGITFTVAPNVLIEDGIEAVRSALSKIWIDEVSCKPFIKAIENYRQEWDDKRRVYKGHPLHDWSSHWADALRYLCVTLPKTADSKSADELNRLYAQARYGGDQSNMPAVFRTDLPNR